MGVIVKKLAKGLRRCIIYCRVSTTGDSQNDSLEEQERVCRLHAYSLGYKDHEIEVKYEKFTGEMLWERKELAEIRQEITAGRVSAFVVKKLDRLARDPIYQGVVIKDVLLAGCQMEIVLEPLDTSPHGELIRFIEGYAHKLEIASFKERSISGRNKKLREGKRGGKRVYGYQVDKENRTLVIDPVTSQVVMQIFRWAIQGKSLHAIALMLTDQGVQPPMAGMVWKKKLAPKVWSPTTVRKILRNTLYKGEDYFGRTTSIGLRENSLSLLVEVPPEKWIPVPSGVPALVEASLWELANASVASHIGKKIRADITRNGFKPVLLRGLAFCSLCGLRLCQIKTQNGKGKTYEYYRCSGAHGSKCRNGGIRCDHVASPHQWLDDLVWDHVVEMIGDREAMRAEFLAHDADSEREALTRDLKTLESDLQKERKGAEALAKRLARAIAEGDDVLAGVFEGSLAEIQNKAKLVQGKAEACRARLESFRSTSDSIDDLEMALDAAEAILGTAAAVPFEAKRLCLEALGTRIEASGRDVTATFTVIPGFVVPDTTETSSESNCKLFHYVLSRSPELACV
jgi:site-specific DNA recombinase